MKASNQYIVGVDQSLNHTAVVVISAEDRSLVGEMLIEPKCTGIERLHVLNTKLRAFLGRHLRYRMGVLEAYSFGSTHRAFDLGEVGGITKLALHDVCDQVEDCAPTALKKYMADHGSSTKEEMKEAVFARWGIRYRDDNLADAFALAQLGFDLLHPQKITTRKQLEVAQVILQGNEKKPPRARAHRPTPGVL